MLKYLISVTEALLASGVMLGMLFGYTAMEYGVKGRRVMTIGSLLGILAAAVMSFMKNKTKLIDTGMWNIRIFTVSLAALLLFLVFDLKLIRKSKAGKAWAVVPVLGAILGFNILFYALPDVMGYPYNIVLGGEPVFSTGFLYRFIGIVLGLILVAVLFVAVQKSAGRMGHGTLKALLSATLIINGIQQASKILQVLVSRRFIKSNHTLFTIIKYCSNYSNFFIYGILLVCLVIPVVLWVRSFHVREPYQNSAQHRKIRAKWRNTRRWATAVVICFMLGVLNLTAVNAYANRAVELSPVESSEVRDGAVYVELEQVEDGHLHRFAYTTDDNITVRFIVIKKPNSSSYGIGLDACDICGETGYYERDGQIVCKLCDVVMNVNTIGFKGGCNPIVIDYSVEGGYIIVPIETLVEHQDEFK